MNVLQPGFDMFAVAIACDATSFCVPKQPDILSIRDGDVPSFYAQCRFIQLKAKHNRCAKASLRAMRMLVFHFTII